ncbi:hypothetical protein LR48_Vigan744s000100 [Vigna angularis]|uniref:Uncharacterized protein n=1 Tax=Phaseolus angularis TaxID=3914 RepID=A0A0L9TGR8_PHAAN|nr:hypothetical protein LR48_Vigan744s000100 [Vigna angularis]
MEGRTLTIWTNVQHVTERSTIWTLNYLDERSLGRTFHYLDERSTGRTLTGTNARGEGRTLGRTNAHSMEGRTLTIWTNVQHITERSTIWTLNYLDEHSVGRTLAGKDERWEGRTLIQWKDGRSLSGRTLNVTVFGRTLKRNSVWTNAQCNSVWTNAECNKVWTNAECNSVWTNAECNSVWTNAGNTPGRTRMNTDEHSWTNARSQVEVKDERSQVEGRTLAHRNLRPNAWSIKLDERLIWLGRTRSAASRARARHAGREISRGWGAWARQGRPGENSAECRILQI